jgi:MFS family permease
MKPLAEGNIMLKNFTKRDISILIGNLLDHFDGALYGFLAPIMAPLFFPNHDPLMQLVLAYSIFATSIVTRPVGAFIFGIWAKKKGPLSSLSISLVGIASCSVMISLIPGYNHIGYFGAILLLLVRFVKGIFASGESVVAKLYILEEKEDVSAFKASYYYQASSILGIILASILSTIIIWNGNGEYFRICYVLGALVGIYGYNLRRQKDLYKATLHDKNKAIFKLQDLFKHRYKILAIIFSTGLSHITYLIPCVIMNSFIPLITEIKIEEMMTLNNILLFLDLGLMIFLGKILERYNYYKITLYLPMILGMSILFLFIPLDGSSLNYVTLVRVWIITIGVAFACPQNLFYKKLFDNYKEQYLITGMANAIGSGVIGKLTPFLTFYLYYKYENMLIIAIYFSLICFATSFFVYKSSQTST